jgi:spore coat protein A, manganese oxidase
MDFAGLATGTEIILQNSAPSPFPGTPGVGVIPNVMKFIVTNQPGFINPLPATLVAVPPIPESEARLSRDFHLRKMFDPVCGHDMWAINDLHWDAITEYPLIGTTEIWSWINRSGIGHPMHLHLVAQQVLDRQDFDVVDGQIVPVGSRIPPPAHEAGWKDTVQAHPGQITRVIARFEGFTGLYPYHCHILEHEDHEMMRQFRVVVSADFDRDGDVDADDFTLFAACASGPTVPYAPGCEAMDLDGDGDVDHDDFGILQRCYSGQDNPADPNCAA